jgi:hydrogenase maturation protein HypF
MQLESVADPAANGEYAFPLCKGALFELDWRPLLSGLLADKQRGVSPPAIAARFHRSLARGILQVCQRWQELPVVLSGGVFQNKLLTELVAEMHLDKTQVFGLPGVIPPNDGGLAAGQLVVAAARGELASCV